MASLSNQLVFFLWTCPKLLIVYIPHGLLVAKMNLYGLSGDAFEFMSSYLTGRFQRVINSDERSS